MPEGRIYMQEKIIQKVLPIGIDDFKELITQDYYYVDKTMLIKELLDKRGKANLFTRPRRFGKTLNLSMLRYFFEDTSFLPEKQNYEELFDGLAIMQAGESYLRHMGKYPVIFISLKSAKQKNFEEAFVCLKEIIAKEYVKYEYIINQRLTNQADLQKYGRIRNQQAERAEYLTCLAFLSDCLYQATGRRSILLIDEYDVPLETAYFNGFYDEMLTFIRSLFESALKSNPSLEFAVITGCLRISKESIFTGLNNLAIYSVLTKNYDEYFGFTQKEVSRILDAYGLGEKEDIVREWYNGYLFGSAEVYNPWSVMNFVHEIVSDASAFPKSYWMNTSSNNIVRRLIERADAGAKQEIEKLISGGTIEKPLNESITYEDVETSQDNLWNFLLFTGYLKVVSKRLDLDTIYLTMAIPNTEIRCVYRSSIREWFTQKVSRVDFTLFYQKLLEGDCVFLENFIKKQLAESISYYDNAENFYHGYLVGILSGMEGYAMDSNREHGEGRPDIMLKPFDPEYPAVIVELKRADRFDQMEAKCASALEQIEEKRYAAELEAEGYGTVRKYGICFCRKSCRVRTEHG